MGGCIVLSLLCLTVWVSVCEIVCYFLLLIVLVLASGYCCFAVVLMGWWLPINSVGAV